MVGCCNLVKSLLNFLIVWKQNLFFDLCPFTISIISNIIIIIHILVLIWAFICFSFPSSLILSIQFYCFAILYQYFIQSNCGVLESHDIIVVLFIIIFLIILVYQWNYEIPKFHAYRFIVVIYSWWIDNFIII